MAAVLGAVSPHVIEAARASGALQLVHHQGARLPVSITRPSLHKQERQLLWSNCQSLG